MTGSQCQSLRLLCERNHELDTEAEAFLLGYLETGNASDAYRRAHDAAPTVCTSMTLVDDKGRSHAVGRETQGSLGLRAEALGRGVTGDAPAQRQRLSVSPQRASCEPAEAVDQLSRGPQLHTARLGVIQPRRRHESLLPMRIQLHQAVSDCWTVVWTCAWCITRCIITIMRALGDRRLHYLGALSWPMSARQPCHAAPGDPPPAILPQLVWETSTSEIYADFPVRKFSKFGGYD